MSRRIAFVIALAACSKKDPGPWHVSRVDDFGQITLERKTVGTFVTLTDVMWPPAELPTAGAAAAEVKRLASTGEIVVTWPDADQWMGPAKVTIGGADLGEKLIAAGFARATPHAPQVLLDAEAKAKAAKLGGWGEAGQKAILGWLRERSLGIQVVGADLDVAAARVTAWQSAAGFEKKQLGFFSVVAGTDPGPPPCVDKLAAEIKPKLKPVTPDDAKHLTTGPTLVDVPTLGPAKCEVWDMRTPGHLERTDGTTTWTRTFEIKDTSIDWLGQTERSAMSSSGGSGLGRATIVGATEDMFVVGGAAWFTTLAACQREVAAAFPSGCSEP